LAWKLTDVIQNKAANTLLDTYDTERQTQIKHTFKQTFLLKEILEADNHLQKWRRNVQIKSMGLLPTKIKTFMQKSFGNPKPLAVGCVDKSSKLAGQHLPQFQLPNSTLSDDKMGYNWTLIYATSAFNKEDISLETCKIPLMSNSEIWEQWLRKNRIDFAIIRPDKIIFSAGRVQNWNTVYANYRKWQLND
jgi:3-(3-hydroxy-phenyl)propionate hydroxylase